MTLASTPSSSWRRLLGSIAPAAIVDGQLEGEHQRLVGLRLGQRHIVDDHELGGRLESVDELTQVLVVAFERHADSEVTETLTALGGLVLGLSSLVSNVRLTCKRGNTREGQ